MNISSHPPGGPSASTHAPLAASPRVPKPFPMPERSWQLIRAAATIAGVPSAAVPGQTGIYGSTFNHYAA